MKTMYVDGLLAGARVRIQTTAARWPRRRKAALKRQTRAELNEMILTLAIALAQQDLAAQQERP